MGTLTCGLVGGAGEWRVRTGDYRIIYEIEEYRLLVLVSNVGHRRGQTMSPPLTELGRHQARRAAM